MCPCEAIEFDIDFWLDWCWYQFGINEWWIGHRWYPECEVEARWN